MARGGAVQQKSWRSRLSCLGAAAGTAACLVLGATAAYAQQGATPDTKAPAGASQAKKPPYVLLRADEVAYDQKSGVVTASGKVEIVHDKEVLRADKVSYDEHKDVVSATGNVVMLQPTGEVMFADHAEFTKGMKDGIVEGFRMLLTDNSRLAAAGGTRTGGVITTLNKAVYSPCELCKDNPKRAPLWRVRAVRVIHDLEAKEVEYKDAFLEMYGIPVFYTPYLSMPDPSVKRRSGFLPPSWGSDSQFGFFVKTPYFWDMAPNEDITITPTFMSDEADVLAADYRRRFNRGNIEVSGSITQPDRRDDLGNRVGGTDTRGHLFAKGELDHDKIWRTRFQVQEASDDTYLRRYHFPVDDEQTLTSSFNTEGFKGDNYAQISGYTFQGLRVTDDPGQSPLVLPYASYDYVSRPSGIGSYFTSDSSVLAISRGEGTDSRRLSLNDGWHLPYTAWTGEIYSLSATLQTDIYSVSDVVTDAGATKSGATGRVFPEIMAQWRYPLARAESHATQVIEPRAAIVLAPNGGNPDKIPNEDSSDTEFDDTNLFSANRFAGVDRVESGTRFIYGVNWSLHGDQGGVIDAFAGQNYRLRKDNAFGADTGLRDQLSDVVGHLRVSPGSWVDFLYRFRFNPDTGRSRRNEVQASIGPDYFKLNANYLFLDENAPSSTTTSTTTTSATQFGDREELTLGYSARINDYWTSGGYFQENLGQNGGPIAQQLALTYKDECFTFKTTATRTFTSDRDLRPTDTLLFQLIFKNLGEFDTSQ